MRSPKTWIDWAGLIAAVAVVEAILFMGVDHLESSAWMTGSQAHAATGVLIIIGGVAITNCAIMIGIGICCARRLDA